MPQYAGVWMDVLQTGKGWVPREKAGCQGLCQPSRTLILAYSPPAGSRQACSVLALTRQAVGK